MVTNVSAQVDPDTEFDHDWWRGCVIYQIYPRSFQDTNGDGIGDMKGIAKRIPYIASLGLDAIWISPFFTSPMADFGYDVSDYCDVDPMFGTLADFDQVVAAAGRHGIRILIDLVISHTSEEHPWFAESRSSRDNLKADWFVWSDSKPDGTPPTNWLSVFGGSAWEWDTRREQYYLHNFLASQPDLNFHNPEVQDAVLDVARFWLDRGVDGFRMDTLNFYFHDAELRDNPVCPPDERTDICAPKVNPYNYQHHVYDRNRPETFDFLRRFRRLLDGYNAAAVGEIGDGQRGLEIIGEYTAGQDLVQMCYAFDMLAADLPTPARIADLMAHVDRAVPDGWVCWAFSNHDCKRHTSRWGLTDQAQRLMATLMMSVRGSACIYQGEELGLPEGDVAFEDLQDPYGIRFWPEFKGRDGCRTPMVWEPDVLNAGFSDSKPWLPVSRDHLRRSVSAQEDDPGAILHHYRQAIAFRHAHPALAKGKQDGLGHDGTCVCFTRRTVGETIFCAFNLSGDPATLTMPQGGDWTPVGAEVGGLQNITGNTLNLGPWQPFFAAQGI
jgi:alpha-glucosidase